MAAVIPAAPVVRVYVQDLEIVAGVDAQVEFPTVYEDGTAVDLSAFATFQGEVRTRDGRLLLTIPCAAVDSQTSGTGAAVLTVATTIGLDAAAFPAFYEFKAYQAGTLLTQAAVVFQRGAVTYRRRVVELGAT